MSGSAWRSALARIVTVCLRWSKTTSASESISAMSGSPRGSNRARRGIAQRLDRAHEVVAEEADRAAGERRRVVDRRLVEARDVLRRERVGVAAVGERPAQHRAGTKADERPAPDALTLVGGLEQERRLSRRQLAQLQEGRHRCLAVLDEAVAQRDQVVRAREDARLLQARLHGRAGPPARSRVIPVRASGPGAHRIAGHRARSDGHRAPAQRP